MNTLIKNSIDEMVESEHNVTEILKFIRECAVEIKNLPVKEKDEMKKYLLEKIKLFPIKKFPVDNNPNYDIIVPSQ